MGLRIPTSLGENQEKGNAEETTPGHKDTGVAIAPEGAVAGSTTETASSPASSTFTSSLTTHPLELASQTSSTSAAILPTKSSTSVNAIELPKSSSEVQQGEGRQSTDLESASLSLSSGVPTINRVSDASNLAAPSTQTAVLSPTSAGAENAFEIFQSARSKQTTATQLASSISSTAIQSKSTVINQESSDVGALPEENPSTASERPGQAPKTTTSAQLATRLTSAPTISSDQANSVTILRTSVDVASSMSVSTSIVQIPSSLLGDEAPSAMALSATSPLHSNAATPPKYAYPDASNGYQAMAQGYNKVFQSLNPLSRCDPNDSKQASACVDGQPAKCELDGTYALQSCDDGKSCYAVPRKGGQPGLDVACFTPSDANKAIADGGKATSAHGSTENNAQSAANPLPTITNPKSKENSKTSATPTDTLNTISKGISRNGFDADSANLPPGAEADTDGNSSPSAATPTYEDISRTVQQSPVASAYISQSASAKDSSAEHNQQTLSSDQSQLEAQQTSSLLSQSTPKPSTDGGVQLSFPGGNGPDSDSRAGPKIQETKSNGSSRDPPPTAQKNALTADQQQQSDQAGAAPGPQLRKDVAAAHIQQPSSTPPSAASYTTAAHTPGITVAPMFGAGNQNGLITVTITQTTTIHDRG